MWYLIIGIIVIAISLFVFLDAKGQKEEGVVINGVKWATRNVGSRGRFVAKPEDYGNYYTYKEAKEACPKGYRLPTAEEIKKLAHTGQPRMKNGVKGYEFGQGENTIFLPSADSYIYMEYLGWRKLSEGLGCYLSSDWIGSFDTRLSVLAFGGRNYRASLEVGASVSAGHLDSCRYVLRCVAK